MFYSFNSEITAGLHNVTMLTYDVYTVIHFYFFVITLSDIILILFGHVYIDVNLFDFCSTSTRGHPFKLFKCSRKSARTHH